MSLSFAGASRREWHGASRFKLRNAFNATRNDDWTRTLLVVDADVQLARVMAAELGDAVGRTVAFAGHGEASDLVTSSTCVLVTEVFALKLGSLPMPRSVRTIRLKAMQEVLAGHQRPPAPALIGVASCSESILLWASTLLSVLGFSHDAVLLRNTQAAGWEEGPGYCDLVATDVVTTAAATSGAASPVSPIVFRVISDSFISEMRNLVLYTVSLGEAMQVI